MRDRRRIGQPLLVRESVYGAGIRLAAEPCRSVTETLFQRHRRIELHWNRAFARVSAFARGEETMATGTVKWFNGQKGFGFIQPNDGGNDVFVHISAVERAGLPGLAEGQRVNFEIATDTKRGKSSAENLSLI